MRLSIPLHIAPPSGGVGYRITGLRETVRALRAAGVDTQEMRDLMHRVGSIVADAARPTVPVLTGATRSTLRAGRGWSKAVVRIGGARAPYTPVVHYGWTSEGIRGREYMWTALHSTGPRWAAELDRGIDEILARNNLI